MDDSSTTKLLLPKSGDEAETSRSEAKQLSLRFVVVAFRRLKCAIVLPLFAFCAVLYIANSVWPHHLQQLAARVTLKTNRTDLAAHRTAPKARQKANGANAGVALAECRLPKLDPWDVQVQPYIDPTRWMNWKKECQPTFKVITRLHNRYVQLIEGTYPKGTTCEFRCLYPRSDWELTFGEWKYINRQPDCDVVEVQCTDPNNASAPNVPFYRYLHAQIYQPLNWGETAKSRAEPTTRAPQQIDVVERPNTAQPNRSPDVVMIVLDSTSHTQLIRSMQKSLTFLRDQMGAVSFPYLNKVGMNSRPNGYGFLLGLQTSPIEASPYGDEWTPERSQELLCGQWMDHEPAYVGFAFRDANYRTMMAEDTRLGVFTWPNCYGMAHPPAEHYMRPFQLRLELKDYVRENETLQADMYNGCCREQHETMLEYLDEFLEVYRDQPKFSLNWLTWITHDTVNGLYHMDDYFYGFLKQNEEKLSNAFVFLMGDHGNRNDYIRRTAQGEIEDNNPALFLTVPRHLRANQRLVAAMGANAKQLITHMDVHSTLLSIVKEGAHWDVSSQFEALDLSEWRGQPLIGESLLFPFHSDRPRHCGSLRIPFEYCICQLHRAEPKEPGLAAMLAQRMVESINGEIERRQFGGKCVQLALHRNESTMELQEYEPHKQMGVFKVTFETLPGNGRFWGFIRLLDAKSNTTALISSRFPRLDLYEKQAYCVQEPAVKPYCYCRELMEKQGQ